MDSVVIPPHYEDLELPREGRFTVEEPLDAGQLAASELSAALDDIDASLMEDVTLVRDQSLFSKLYGICKTAATLPEPMACRLVCCLAGALTRAASATAESPESSTAAAARDSLRLLLCSAAHVGAQCEPVFGAIEDTRTGAAKAKPKKGSKKAAAAAAAAGAADASWQHGRLALCEALAALTSSSYASLWPSSLPEAAFTSRALQAGTRLLAEPGPCKHKAARTALCLAIATLVKQVPSAATQAASALCALAYKHEWATGPVADTLVALVGTQDRSEAGGSSGDEGGRSEAGWAAAGEVVREVGRLTSTGTKDPSGLRNVAALVTDLGARAPRLLLAHLSVLLPHLDSDVPALRSALVTAFASVVDAVAGAADDQRQAVGQDEQPGAAAAGSGSGSGDRSEVAHSTATSAEQVAPLLEVVLDRMHDSNAFVRAAALRVLGKLCSNQRLEPGQLVQVVERASPRLMDKAGVVRRCALALLRSALGHNPFAARLDPGPFEEARSACEAWLSEHGPASVRLQLAMAGQKGGSQRGGAQAAVEADLPPVDEGSDPAAVGKENDPAAAEAAAGAGHDEVKAEAEAEAVDSADPLQALAEAAANESVDDWTPAQQEKVRFRLYCAAAVTFAGAMGEALAHVQRLLKSTAATDVVEAVRFVCLAGAFHIPGARETISSMLQLVYSSEQTVKDAVVEGFKGLYIDSAATAGRQRAESGVASDEEAGPDSEDDDDDDGPGSSAQCAAERAAGRRIASNLVRLAATATVSAAASLEELLGLLARRGDLPPACIRALWVFVGAGVRATRQLQTWRTAAAAQGSSFRPPARTFASAQRAVVRARAAMQLVGMVAGARPEVVDSAGGIRRLAAVLNATTTSDEIEEQEEDGEEEACGTVDTRPVSDYRLVRRACQALARARPFHDAPGASGATAAVDLAASEAAAATARAAAGSPNEGDEGLDGVSEAATERWRLVGRVCGLLEAVIAGSARPADPNEFTASRQYFPAAAAALDALFVLHPRPVEPAEAALSRLASALQTAGARAKTAAAAAAACGAAGDEAASQAVAWSRTAEALLARLLFVGGHVGLRCVTHAEQLARALKKTKVKAAETANEAEQLAATGAGSRAGKRGKAAAGKKKKGKSQSAAASAAADLDAQLGGAGGASASGRYLIPDPDEELAMVADDGVVCTHRRAPMLDGEGDDDEAEATAGAAAQEDDDGEHVEASAEDRSERMLGAVNRAFDAAQASGSLANAADTTAAELAAVRSSMRPSVVTAVGAVAGRTLLGCLDALEQAPGGDAGRPLALAQSALLCLGKLMALSAPFCEAQLRLLFTALQRCQVESFQCAALVILGDLCFRHPNILDEWTPRLYRRLRDPHTRVRRTAMMVLSHLCLNDMVKVRGQVAEIAVCLSDTDERVAGLARLFFQELGNKAGNPVYNLTPDILSCLSAHPSVDGAMFRRIMKFLLGFISKDRQVEALAEKLCSRCEKLVLPADVQLCRDLAFCVAHLPHSNNAAKRVMEMLSVYRHALAEAAVYESFSAVQARFAKSCKPEQAASIEEWGEALTAAHKRGASDSALASTAAKATRKSKRGKRQATRRSTRSRRAQSAAEEEEEEEEELENAAASAGAGADEEVDREASTGKRGGRRRSRRSAALQEADANE